MYFTSLPDHSAPGFDEQAHFNQFSRHNVIFNAYSPAIQCDDHIGCLSIKTILTGEEWYSVDGRHVAVRPGQFLILNDDQNYSYCIRAADGARGLSIFFQKEFAASVLHDMLQAEEQLLDDPSGHRDNPSGHRNPTPEFFQTLHATEPDLAGSLSSLVTRLDTYGDDPNRTDEELIFLLQYLLRTYRSDKQLYRQVDAVKPATQKEIYKRLCIAKDVLHSFYQEPLDLAELSTRACLSTPQLVRQFKSVFGRTPYRYLVDLRLRHAAYLLMQTPDDIRDITWRCGFNDPSAFCRAFRTAFGLSPGQFRTRRQ
jgi:AraC-like DNA-binding protein